MQLQDISIYDVKEGIKRVEMSDKYYLLEN